MPRMTFVKIDTVSHRDCFLQTVLKDDGNEGFHLTATDGVNIWTGNLTEEDMDNLSEKAKMTYQDFVSITVNAFTQDLTSSLNFEFDLKDRGDNSVNLIWKKHVPVDNIKFQLGSVVLHRKEQTAKNISDIFQQCITRTTSLQERIRSLNTDNERLSQERAMALKRLDKCVTAKDELEKDLYEKFVAVLNSKKEKIRALKRQIGDRMTRDKDDDQSVPSTSRASDGSESEDAKNGVGSSSVASASLRMQEDQDTDDESPTVLKKRCRGPATRPSKKDADSSLVLEGEDEEAASATVAKRPARRRAANKKQTPVKPILPKVTSRRSEGGDGEGRRSSMRKSSSRSSNRSSDYNDPDALMDDLE